MNSFEDEMWSDQTLYDVQVINSKSNKELSLKIGYQTPVSQIFNRIASEYDFSYEIELIFQGDDEVMFVLNEYKGKTVAEMGSKISKTGANKILVQERNVFFSCPNEDELHLGASASPTASEMLPVVSLCELPPVLISDYCPMKAAATETSSSYALAPAKIEPTPPNYVGLVNQAMTCYLNSLLQALYMTPEFRNALYNWEFDGQNERKSIPYQLQKLFLNLQTSSKSAVETTDLTTSFGWQGSDAWHQHDIQELCRVMFDALEQKFKDTRQANLINDLYEGKMLDYVKCLECGTESSREDTFQDIPLPVRPFGSTVAYNSVEEALRAFVQPETLEGNNQYHCERCKKKCDAHKGLKFIKFPYLLTLHLKRFDFDYNTMHRIKLNDKVVFSEVLNLNSFAPTPKQGEQHEAAEGVEERETVVKCDDCSTTDSGSADDESCQGTDVSSTVNGPDDNCADSDEGIDVSSGTNLENDAKGPYMYELFSILIHSGSASGGHYYAYIKDFDKDRWFCFNDQSVSAITEDDIRKTYGGGPQRGYYSGAYSSSTNAYMLMYRQIDKARNCRAIDVDTFPPHITRLLDDMRRKEDEDRISREKENDLVKFHVYCINPETGNLEEHRISVTTDSTLKELACQAHYRFKLEGIAAVEDCRIVMYNKKHQCIKCSFESEDIQFGEIYNKSAFMFSDWLLEIKKPEDKFEIYRQGGIDMRVYAVDLDTEEIQEPRTVRVHVDDTVRDVKDRLGQMLEVDARNLKVIQYVLNEDPIFWEDDDALVQYDLKHDEFKLFVALSEDAEKAVYHAKVHRIIDKFGYVVSLDVVLPETDVGTLESLSIPSLDLNQNLDKLELGNGDRGTNSPRTSPQPGMSGDGFGGDQSNSEDSSLSDSDRTLVGDAPGEGLGQLSSSSNSPADQLMTSLCDPAEDTYNYDVFRYTDNRSAQQEEMHWDDEETQNGQKFDIQEARNQSYFFKVTSLRHHYHLRCVRVLADRRMTMERLKKHLEVFVRVPVDYFKIFRYDGNMEDEWSTTSDSLRNLRNGERLVIKLGRVLRKNEYNTKVFHLKLDNPEPHNFLFEHIIAKGQSVGAVKREILIQMKKQHMLDVPYGKCRLREKNWKKPRKVYLDEQKFGDDIVMTNSLEIYVQDLPEGEPMKTDAQQVLFLRKWSPEALSLGGMEEIVMDTTRITELRTRISEASGIPEENVDFAHVKSSFPCDMHVLEINDELSWNPNVTHCSQWPITADDGSVFFYRDNREAVKELSAEERKELNIKENARLGRHTLKSPGRERGLKIYLDTSPCKPEDNYID